MDDKFRFSVDNYANQQPITIMNPVTTSYQTYDNYNVNSYLDDNNKYQKFSTDYDKKLVTISGKQYEVPADN